MIEFQHHGPDFKHFCAFWIALLGMLPVANSAEVVLTSDPPGAVISVAGKETGVTPLTLDLPAGQPIEIASRFGPLGALVHTLTPDENQVIAYQFKHEYGTIVITCDRTDAALMIDGTGYGHPPAVVLVSPGTHKLFMTASNAPDKTREVEVAAGQRATVEMDFSGGSPETTKTSVSPQSGPEDSPSPAPKASPSPKGRGPKPSPADRGTIAWQEPPPLIPSATPPGKPEPSPTPASRQKSVVKAEKKISTHVGLVSESGSPAKERATPSPSASPPPDGAKERAMIKEVWRVKEQALQAEKTQIVYGIKTSTGAIREQWKYRLAVWAEKMKAAKQEEAAVR